jgi:hypothetical protein
VRRRNPKHIQVNESGLTSLEGKLPNCTICYHSYKIIKEYFELKSNVSKCQLFLALFKSISLTHVRRILGIKIVKSVETSHHIVRNIVDAFQIIGKKSLSKDRNAPRLVLSQSIASNITRKHCFLHQTSLLLKCNVKTLRNYSHKRYRLDTTGPTDLWAFTSRLPCFGMKLIGVVKGLVQDF